MSVSPPGLGTPTTPPASRRGPLHRAGGTTREQRHIAETWESHCRSDTPKMWGLWEFGHGTAAKRIPAPSWRPGHPSRVPLHRLPSPYACWQGFGDPAVPTKLIPCNPPALPAAHKGAWLCHHPHVARHGTGAKVQARLLRQQIPAGSRLVSRRSPGVASTGVFRTD